MSLLIYRGQYVQLDFACVPQGGLAFFHRGEDSIYILCDDVQAWRPVSLPKKVIVPMFDTCPHPSLNAYEYRVWNEYALSRFVKGLRGDGVLTLTHRLGVNFHLGLSWSRYPLTPVSESVTDEPPRWWGAEGSAGTFPELRQRVDNDLYRWELEWEQRRVERLFNPPPPQTPAELAEREASRVRFIGQIQAALNEAVGERQLGG